MTDHRWIPSQNPPYDEQLRLLGLLIDGVMAQACARHYEAETQEHQLNSRIAGALERELTNVQIGGMSVQVVAQELSDRGRGSKEKKIGADLYVSITVEDGAKSISKGLLVQSKWDDNVDDPRLATQTRSMLERSKESYVWTYGPSGVSVEYADVDRPHTEESPKTVGKLLSDGVACTAGDPQIGLEPGPVVPALNSRLRELAVPTGVSFVARMTSPQRG